MGHCNFIIDIGFHTEYRFGYLERPIRPFEVVADVVNSWDKDRTVNTIIVKMSQVANLLRPSVSSISLFRSEVVYPDLFCLFKAIPSSSPKYSGWVEWESKKGKWNKRWMELREHSLWLSKRETVRRSFHGFSRNLQTHSLSAVGQRRDLRLLTFEL